MVGAVLLNATFKNCLTDVQQRVKVGPKTGEANFNFNIPAKSRSLS